MNVNEEQSEGVKCSQGNAGVLISQQTWNSSPFVSQQWTTRWTTKGLMPVRPVVVVVAAFDIPPKGAICLTHTKGTR